VEEDNDEGSLGFDHRPRGESIGTVNGGYLGLLLADQAIMATEGMREERELGAV
jgi:hypothetical protein